MRIPLNPGALFSLLCHPQPVALSSRLTAGCRAPRDVSKFQAERRGQGQQRAFLVALLAKFQDWVTWSHGAEIGSGEKCFQPVRLVPATKPGKEEKMHPEQTARGWLSKTQSSVVTSPRTLVHASPPPSAPAAHHRTPSPTLVTEQPQCQLQHTRLFHGSGLCLCSALCLECPFPALFCMVNSYSSFKTLLAPPLRENTPRPSWTKLILLPPDP